VISLSLPAADCAGGGRIAAPINSARIRATM